MYNFFFPNEFGIYRHQSRCFPLMMWSMLHQRLVS